MGGPQISAAGIVGLLADRHVKDVFVPECKDGPTQLGSHLRLDAWAMRKSWVNFSTLGYEIKVSRSDWMRDQKWESYRGLVHELYLVAPKGLIQVDELPAGVGLIEVVGSKRLVTRRKAVWEEIPPPEDLYKYVLMCRAKIQRTWVDPTSNATYWREWLALRDEDKTMGHHVSKALREKYDREVRSVRHENEELKRQADSVRDVYQRMTDLGLNGRWLSDEGFKRRCSASQLGIPEGLADRLEDAARRLRELETVPNEAMGA